MIDGRENGAAPAEPPVAPAAEPAKGATSHEPDDLLVVGDAGVVPGRKIETEPLPLLERDGPAPGPELRALVEALLLVASEPPTIDELARGTGVPREEIETELSSLEAVADRGWVVVRHHETAQLASAPRFGRFVRRFLGLDRESRLSSAALEALAVIAYRQPVTRGEVESVRGVDCAGVLSTLHARGLISAVGRLETVGHPIQYGTTPDFLRHFGLRAIRDLPPLGQVEGNDAIVLLEAAMLEQDDAAATQATAGAIGREARSQAGEVDPG